MSHTRFSELHHDNDGKNDIHLPYFYIEDIEKVISNMKEKKIVAFQPCRVNFFDKDNPSGKIEGWTLVGVKPTKSPLRYTRVLHQDAQIVLGCGYFNYNLAALVEGEDAKASSKPPQIPLVTDVEFEFSEEDYDKLV